MRVSHPINKSYPAVLLHSEQVQKIEEFLHKSLPEAEWKVSMETNKAVLYGDRFGEITFDGSEYIKELVFFGSRGQDEKIELWFNKSLCPGVFLSIKLNDSQKSAGFIQELETLLAPYTRRPRFFAKSSIFWERTFKILALLPFILFLLLLVYGKTITHSIWFLAVILTTYLIVGVVTIGWRKSHIYSGKEISKRSLFKRHYKMTTLIISLLTVLLKKFGQFW
jgi:hypothetical protein